MIALATAVLLLVCSAANALDVPGTGGRVTASGYLDGLAVVGTEDSPDQDPQALLVLRADAPLAQRLRAHLELRGREGGPFEGGHPGFYSLVHTFQNRSPSAEATEAWVEASFRKADVRVGIQRFAWGKLDGIPPTDVLNPADYHDPIVVDWEERKIGVPAIWGRYYLPDVSRLRLSGLNASLTWVPFAIPSRLPLLQERWFPGATIAGDALRIDAKTTSALLNVPAPAQRIPLEFETQNHRPSIDWHSGGIGLRLGGTIGTTDVAFYHYSGAYTGPDIDIRSFAKLCKEDCQPHMLIRSRNLFRQANDVMHMVGGDLATTIGGATVRAEVASLWDRPYLRLAKELVSPNALTGLKNDNVLKMQFAHHRWVYVPLGDLFVDRDSAEWGIGADYLWRGWMPLLQVNQVVFYDDGPALVVRSPETRLTGSLRKSFFGERVLAEVRGIYTIEPHSWFVYPRVDYLVRDDLRLRLGYLAIGGPLDSLIGQYKQNDEVVFQARYSF